MCLMMKPFLRPWVGSHYERGYQGVRLMIMGESHYRDKEKNDVPEDASYTRRTITRYCGGRNFKFFTNVMQLVTGGTPKDTAARCAFWNAVSFYNYIQRILERNSERRTRAMWCEGLAAFVGAVKELRPELVIVFGKSVWDCLPFDSAHMKGFRGEMQVLPIGCRAPRIIWVYHPGARRDHRALSRKRIQSALNAIKKGHEAKVLAR
jgi:hypothetical protein